MKKCYILILIFVIFIVSITVVGTVLLTGNKEIDKVKDVFVMQDNIEKYFDCYGYTIDNPNVIINPYGNSPLTAIVMFTTNDYDSITVRIKGITDIDDIVYIFNKNKYHLIPIYGLYPNTDNTVVLKDGDYEKVLNIKTDPLPDDFDTSKIRDGLGNYHFDNSNYPYAIDNSGNVRWFLNASYYGDIVVLNNSKIVIGSDKYVDDNMVISLYQMNLLGKIYNEYFISNSYYGRLTMYNDNILLLSDSVLEIDLQTGEIVKKYVDNNNYDYINTNGDDIILESGDKTYKLENDNLVEIEKIREIKNYSFYNNTTDYKISGSNKFGTLLETEKSHENISLLKYEKKMPDNIKITMDNDRITVYNDTEEDVYLILDKFLDKRVYEIPYIKYINTTGLNGKYTVYFKVGKTIYKTDYYIEV